jgi:maltose alpha-D-glucosyltransferase/alpha-amylase
MRKRLSAFGRGDIKFIESNNSKILSFSRTFEKQRIIVVANLSQFSQAATLDLAEFKDCDITEAFSQNRFKNIENGEYYITIGPYGYFWFQIDVAEKKGKVESSGELPVFESDISWERVFHDYDDVRDLERKILPLFMKKCRWFGGKAKTINKMGFHKVIPLKVDDIVHYLTIVEVHYIHGLPELYFLPMTFLHADRIVEYTMQSVICRAEIQEISGFIIDSSYDKDFREYLFVSMDKEVQLKTGGGELQFRSSLFSKIKMQKTVESKLLKADQSNTAIIYNDQYFLKFYRKIEGEINPDLEIIRFLSEHTNFRNSPKYAGSIEFNDENGANYVFGMMQEKVEHQGDAWVMTVDSVGRFYERVLTSTKKDEVLELVNEPTLKFEEAPELIQELIGRGFYERITRLGQRTAEMHLALASDQSNPAFAPEEFNANYQRSMYSALRKLVRDRFSLLESVMSKLPKDVQVLGKKVLALEEDILECFSEVFKGKINAIKTRIHGDYHLGQVLFTGKDFIIIDFEGEPGFSFSERRLKKNPLKDVAGMMRSIHYAAFGKILLNENYRTPDREVLEVWAEQWQHYIARFYLGAYLDGMGVDKFTAENDTLIRTFLLEKAVYELGYELNGRPDWVIVPLRGIDYLMRRYFQEKGKK